jgi:hypothetical protein
MKAFEIISFITISSYPKAGYLVQLTYLDSGVGSQSFYRSKNLKTCSSMWCQYRINWGFPIWYNLSRTIFTTLSKLLQIQKRGQVTYKL